MNNYSHEYRENGDLEKDVHEMVSKHLLNPEKIEESRKKSKRDGIVCLLITILIAAGAVSLLVWGITTSEYRVLKIIGFVILLLITAFMGILTHVFLTPPKNVNGFGKTTQTYFNKK